MNENIAMSARELAIRSYLSADCAKAFDDMYYCRMLGAASNIAAIGGMYADLAATAPQKGLDGKALADRVKEISDYFIEKRGGSSHAIVTAIRIMTAGLDPREDAQLDGVRAFLSTSYAAYQARARAWTKNIMDYGWNVIEPMERILLFDYSSTVNAMMEAAAEHGRILHVYVPESRALDGGRAFLVNGAALGHRMHYFPDAAIARFVERVDAAFIGAETLFPDGSVANTVGSDLTAIACQYHGKPLYVPTSLIKLNPRGFFGYKKRESLEDAGAYFGLHLDDALRARIDLRVPGLITVAPSLITAFITEVGVVPPAGMYQVCREFMRDIEQGVR